MPGIPKGTLALATILLGSTQIQQVRYGTVQIWANEVVVVLPAANSIVLKSYFTSVQWANVNLKKRVVVPTGVQIGATNASYAIAATISADLQAGSWAGSLTLEIRGTVSGIGGAANSGKGGDVIWVNFPGRNGEKLQINVLAGGVVRAGGGGGGASGTGGQGFYQTPYTYQEGPTFSYPGMTYVSDAGGWHMYWGGTFLGNSMDGPLYYGDYVYYRHGVLGHQVAGGDSDEGYYTYNYYYILRQQTRYNNYYPLGGAARAGGRGQGFDGAAAAGGAAVGGAGSGAGASGTGGTGGAYGASGGAGTAGVNGNYGAATGGAAGGLAGFYLNGAANSNIANAGTLQGRVA